MIHLAMESTPQYTADDLALWQAKLLHAQAELAVARAENADALATITHQKLVIAKLQNALSARLSSLARCAQA